MEKKNTKDVVSKGNTNVVIENEKENEKEMVKKYNSCGLIMPISKIDNCDENHWESVKKIVVEAIDDIFGEVRLVSDYIKSGVIQKNIVQAIYSDDLVICDVSCKNPNVMFELGMRLAFDKPTLIIFDGDGNYPFDINNLKYLKYPRSLEYHKIKKFQEELKSMIVEVLEHKNNTFLNTFGKFKKYEIKEDKVDVDSMNALTLVKKMDDMEVLIGRLFDRVDTEIKTRRRSTFDVKLIVEKMIAKLYDNYMKKRFISNMNFLDYLKDNLDFIQIACGNEVPINYILECGHRYEMIMKNSF